MRNFYISEKDYEAKMMDTVMPYLSERRSDAYFDGYDKNPIHYVAYKIENSIGSIVVSHGFTESTEKFHELTYYFLLSGYNVFLADHRGHGKSYRTLDDKTLTHITDFDEYVSDFLLFVDEVKRFEKGDMILFCHSMGCAVGLLFLEKNPTVFKRAFISSPMVVPNSGSIPLFLARAVAKSMIIFGKSEKRAFISKEYPGKEIFADSCKTSESRFNEYEMLKRKNKELQNYSPTYGWVYASLKVGERILKNGEVEKIKIPVFVAIASRDDVVLRKPQDKLVKRLPHGSSKVFDAKHEIYGSVDDVAFDYFDCLLNFISEK